MNLNTTNQLLELMNLSARLILQNGGETYRVEETVKYIAARLECGVEVFVLPTAILIMLHTPGGEEQQELIPVGKDGTAMPLRTGGHTFLQSIRVRSMHLAKLEQVNRVVRQFCAGKLELEDALEQLQHIQQQPVKSMPLVPLCWALGAGFTTLLFGGGWVELLAAAVAAALITVVLELTPNLSAPHLISGLIIGFLSGTAAELVPLWFGVGNANVIAAGALMPFLPGLALTNAIRDTMAGDLVSGGARLGEVLVRAAALAFGAGAALALL